MNITTEYTRFSSTSLSPLVAGGKGQSDADQPIHPCKTADGQADATQVLFGAIRGRDKDSRRFWDIVKGRQTPKDLLDHISHRQVKVGKDGKVRFPMPNIKRPSFNYGPNPPWQQGEEDDPGNSGDGSGKGSGKPGQGQGQGKQPGPGGVGTGQGGIGDVIDREGDGDGEGGDNAGQGEGNYEQEQWGSPYPPSYVAKIIGKDFGLPFIELKGHGKITEISERWVGTKRVPPGIIRRRDTLGPAIAREAHMAEQENREFDPERLMVRRADEVIRLSDREQKNPRCRAAIIYVMDVSGSISEWDKEMARTNNFFLSTWLKYQYGLMAAKAQKKTYNDEQFFGKGVEERFVIFTHGAREVSERDFYTTRQSGGTAISTGIEKAKEIIDKNYPPDEWNVYLFMYSDGDSWSDNKESGDMIQGLLDSGMRLFGYNHLGHDPSEYYGFELDDEDNDWGNFKPYIDRRFKKNQHVRSTILSEPELPVYKEAIRTLLAPEGKSKRGGKK